MTIPHLKYNLHDANLSSLEIGPRRELALRVVLTDLDCSAHLAVRIRFAAISNFPAVQAYFKQITPLPFPDAYLDRVDSFGYHEDEESCANKLVFRLDLDRHGPITIRCRNLTVSEDIPNPELIGN